MKNTAIVVLAAGNSSRFGSSKQLARLNNKTLLQHAIDEAVGSGAASVIVVMGANSEVISKTIDNGVQLVLNENWEDGMASSIVKGVGEAIVSGDIKKIIIALSDQPFVSSTLFRQLVQTQEDSAKSIVASSYAGTIGTPALFTQFYFDALMKLEGEEGAKKILKSNRQDVVSVDFSMGEIDIDTQQDYESFLDRQKSM